MKEEQEEMDANQPMMKTESSRKARCMNQLLKWKVLAITFIIVSIALLIALIAVAMTLRKIDEKHQRKIPESRGDDNEVKACLEGFSPSPGESPRSAGVFDDLTVNEIIAVRDYLLHQTELNLTKIEQAAINSNYITSVQLLPPPKADTLAYLDGKGNKPERKAIAVVFRGGDDPP